MKALAMVLLVALAASDPHYVPLQTLGVAELTTTLAFCNQTIFIGTQSNKLISFTFNGTDYATASTITANTPVGQMNCIPTKSHLLYADSPIALWIQSYSQSAFLTQTSYVWNRGSFTYVVSAGGQVIAAPASANGIDFYQYNEANGSYAFLQTIILPAIGASMTPGTVAFNQDGSLAFIALNNQTI